MLIIKGNSEKHAIGNILMGNTRALCIAYGDYCPTYAWYHIDNTNSSEEFLEHFLKISEHIYKNIDADCDYQYFIIYTNQNEEDLKDIIDWLNEHKHSVPCKDIVLICK